jgi:hypothetical protein
MNIQPDRRTAVSGAVLGAILGIIPALITLLTTKPAVSTSGYPVLDFLGGTAWDLLQWIGLGWLVGYSLPLIQGRNGSEKALGLFLTGIGAILPMAVIWDDNNDWIHVLIFSLELLFFLMLTAICLCDLRTLRKAGMRLADWFTVQHWHFVVTWSTALLAALGTAVVTFFPPPRPISALRRSTALPDQALRSSPRIPLIRRPRRIPPVRLVGGSCPR